MLGRRLGEGREDGVQQVAQSRAGRRLVVGDEDSGGGLVGKVVKIGENYVTLEIAEGTEVVVQKPAIGLVLPKGTLKSL